MSFYSKLRDQLEGKIPDKGLDELPRGYQILGRIMILKLRNGLLKYRKVIGKVIMGMFPYIDSVCLAKDIGGVKRKPKIEVIAGCKSTETTNIENGCVFLLDVSKVMWSQGNKEEKMRLVRMVKRGETMVDMFAGIGYFTIPVAKHCSPKKIYAIDVNPQAIDYLRKNVWMNGVESRVEILEGDCRKFTNLLESSADRISMGYLFDTEKFLPCALKIARNGAIIHFHRNAREDEIDKIKKKIVEIGRKSKCGIKILKVNEVKSYAPKVFHMVFDLKVSKKDNG
jgi:tRNA wybutosine-synthesizing protein 2